MSIASQNETIEMQHKAWKLFPRQLLQIIAAHPGSREHQFLTWMHNWLPLSPDIDKVRSWVNVSLDWFLSQGHIQREPGGRINCVPAYAFGSTGNQEALVRLYGHPSAEFLCRQYNIDVLYTLVQPSKFDPASGVERTLRITLSQRDLLSKAGLRFISAQELEELLPHINTLYEPGLPQNQPTLTHGMFHVYDPGIKNGNNWRQWNIGNATASPLVRWTSDGDQQQHGNERYLYCLYNTQFAPLTYQEALLWRFRLDADYQSRVIYWQAQEGYIWLPLGLPSIFWQWLKLIAPTPPEKVHNRMRLQVERAMTPTIRRVLTDRLGLQWAEGLPVTS